MSSDDEEYTYESEGDYDAGCEDLNTKDDGLSYSSPDQNLKTDTAPAEGNFIIKPMDDIVPFMTKFLNEVSSLLDVNLDQAQVLLQKALWDKEKLMDRFFSDSEKFANKLSLSKGSAGTGTNESKGDSGDKNDDSNTFKCRICYDTCSPSEVFMLGCMHGFCYDCYTEYIIQQISDGPSCIYMACPEHKCAEAKYDLYVQRNFIESCKKYRYCPAPGCDKVFVGSGVTNVKCSCGQHSCFRCGNDAHEPSSCSQLEMWQVKCNNESETANWIIVNTKKCPHCTSRIEKNQGCNHMSCKVCKHEFCWICMDPWSDHGQATGGYYKCNRFELGKVSEDASDAEKAKAELERYLHYYQRYHGHDHALTFANSLRDKAEKRMIESQETNQASWLEVQFIKQAAEQVIECRRLLKYTYILGYYIQDNTTEKQLFEHHQEMLEKNTERLHECTEEEISKIDRAQVINLTRVTEKFMVSLKSTVCGGVIQLGEDLAETELKSPDS
eukprot:GSChrysophyteH1.ASY1.ANO1.4.1 assembled CDS